MAIDVRIASILGGGYPTQERKLSPDQRKAIFTRDSYLCKLCGDTATEIDHIHGSSPDTDNLQAICKPCNMAKAMAACKPATPEQQEIGDTIWERIRSQQPLRICDEEKDWDKRWRGIVSSRKEAYLELLEEEEKDNTPYFTGSEEGDEYFLKEMSKD